MLGFRYIIVNTLHKEENNNNNNNNNNIDHLVGTILRIYEMVNGCF
jgi:hypothetical protein